jgi:phage shock protein A
LAAAEAAKSRLQDTVDGLTAQVTEEAQAASELRRQVADLRSHLSTYGAALNA